MCFCLFSKAISANERIFNYTVSKVSPDDGLSQGSNYFRFEDSKGFMWITANDAINRFDGAYVKVYNLNQYFDSCPPLQQGYGFAEDEKGNVYIGSVRGLYVYDRFRDKFSLKKIFKSGEEEVAMPFGFYDGKIWCFNQQFQLATYDITTQKIQYIGKADLQPLASIHIYQLADNIFYFHYPFIDKKGNCWLPGNKDLARFEIKSGKFSYPLRTWLQQNNRSIISSTYNIEDNNLWLGTNQGIVIYDLQSEECKIIQRIGDYNFGRIDCIAVNQNLAVFKVNGKLTLSPKDLSFIQIAEDNYWKSFLVSFDKSGRLWICDDGQGQIVFDFKGRLLNKFPDEYVSSTFEKSILISGVGNFAEFPNGDILIQSKILLKKKSKKINFFNQLDKYIVHHKCIDTKRNGIWFFVNTINSKDKTEVLFKSSVEDIPISYIINSKDVGILQDLFLMPDGNILCSYSTGLYRFIPEKSQLNKIDDVNIENPFKINSLDNNSIAISCLNGDMVLLKIVEGNKLKFIRNILQGIQTFYIQEDTKRKQYWVGTNKGVYLLNTKFRVLKIFDANNGLAGTYIYGLLLDNEGNVWCSHQRGLSSIQNPSFKIINYDKNDGIQDWDFNNRSFYKATDGTLFFGGVSGFNYFKPPLVSNTFYKPQVYIDEILINGKSYSDKVGHDFLKQIKLSFSENNISIKAIIKDLVNAKTKQLIYRIKENNLEWKYLPNNSQIIFNSMAPGSYTLQLGYYDKYTLETKFQKSLMITIGAPFYYKTWFIALVAMLLTLIIFGFYNQRKLRIQKAMFQQQMALERQRQKFIEDLHDDIGASLSSLQINSSVANRLIENDLGKAKIVLDKIEQQSKNLGERIGDFIWSLKPGFEEFIGISGRIKNFAYEILGNTNIDYDIDIDNNIDNLLKDFSSRKNILFITKEAINNAVKYSGAKKISISLQILSQSQGVLIINDDGKGFIVNAVNGNGLRNMQKRAQEIKADFRVNSIENRGTEISLRFKIVP